MHLHKNPHTIVVAGESTTYVPLQLLYLLAFQYRRRLDDKSGNYHCDSMFNSPSWYSEYVFFHCVSHGRFHLLIHSALLTLAAGRGALFVP